MISNAFLHSLAPLMEYPTAQLGAQTHYCADLLQQEHPEWREQFEPFLAFVTDTSFTRVQELYTNTFDLQVVCYPYVGYHLFGESYKRGALLAKLKEEYRAVGLVNEAELPDHVGLVLRFLALLPPEQQAIKTEIISTCFLVALKRMQGYFKAENPYQQLFRLLFEVLAAEYPCDDRFAQIDLSMYSYGEGLTLNPPC